MKGIFKTFAIGILIGFILFIIDGIFRFIATGTLNLNSGLIQSFLLYVLYAVPLTFVNSYFFDHLNRQEEAGMFKKYKLIIGLGGSVILSLFTFFIVRMIHIMGIDGKSYQEFILSENLQMYFVSLLLTLVIALIFQSFYLYKELQEKRVKEQKVIAGTASAKFESLKNQIDPHFLFNSLNVLTSLIEENPENAQKFTTSLSKIYRYVLEQKDKELVSVEEELSFAKTYMNLLKMRFENSVFYDVTEILSNPDAKVVPLSLQLLLENVIKHNTVSETKPLRVHIYEEENNLVIENNYQKKDVLQHRQGVGLQNIISRYNIVTHRKVVIDQNDKKFRVKLPLLTQKITVMENYNSSERNAYFSAKARVKELKEFYGNFISYCLVIPFLIFINYYTRWDFQWFWFPLLGWGLGLTVHAFSVFGYGAKWEERKIEEIMAKEKQQNKSWK